MINRVSGATTLDDQWHVATGIKELSTEPWTGETWFTKVQKETERLKHTEIHSSYEQLDKLYSQGGEVIMLYDASLPTSQSLQQVTIAAWKSYRLRRRTVNTLSSETQAVVRGLGSVHWYRVLILETLGLRFSAREWHEAVSQLPFIAVTDSKSLYDAVKKCMNPASQCDDKRTSIDISLIKQELAHLNGSIRWIDGRVMIADGLTKACKTDYLRHVLRSGTWCILKRGQPCRASLQSGVGDTQRSGSPHAKSTKDVGQCKSSLSSIDLASGLRRRADGSSRLRQEHSQAEKEEPNPAATAVNSAITNINKYKRIYIIIQVNI